MFHQSGTVELASMTGDDVKMVQGPLGTYLLTDIFKPDPAGDIRIFSDDEVARRRQITWQVILPIQLVGIRLALVIIPGTKVGVILRRAECF